MSDKDDPISQHNFSGFGDNENRYSQYKEYMGQLVD